MASNKEDSGEKEGSSGRKKVGGKREGTIKYNNKLLLDVIQEIKPASTEEWNRVAKAYQIRSAEQTLRDSADIKKHYNVKLCLKNQRQTGLNNKSGPTPECARAQEIMRMILTKENCINTGGSDSDDARLVIDDDDELDDDDEANGDFEPVRSGGSGWCSSNDNPYSVSVSRTDQSSIARKVNADESDSKKSKNSRPSMNPRGGAQAAIGKLCDTMANNQANNSNNGMMQMMMQSMQQNQQMMQNFMMQMMMMQRPQYPIGGDRGFERQHYQGNYNNDYNVSRNMFANENYDEERLRRALERKRLYDTMSYDNDADDDLIHNKVFRKEDEDGDNDKLV